MEKKNTYIEYNLLTYLTDYMKKDADNFKTAANVPTGYANLYDDYNILLEYHI